MRAALSGVTPNELPILRARELLYREHELSGRRRLSHTYVANLAAYVRGLMREEGASKGELSWGVKEGMEWLAEPEEWSPFVDDIAIERAMGFDWDVIHSLSRLEMAVFLRKLLAHPDPFEGWESRRGNDDKATWTDAASRRRIAFEAGTRDDRRELMKRVGHLRSRLEAAAMSA